MTIHNIKLSLPYAIEIAKGNKRFEIRKNDRNYKEEDYVAFKIVDIDDDLDASNIIDYFENHIYKITYITDFAQTPDYVVFGIKEYELHATL